MAAEDSSNALGRVDTLIRPRDLGGTVEVVIASRASRSFSTRQSASLGVCLKLGPAHMVNADGRALEYPAESICVRPPGCIWSSADTGLTGFVSIDIAVEALPAEQRGGAMRFVGPDALPDLRAIARLLLSGSSRLAKDEAISTLVSAVMERQLMEWPELRDGAGWPQVLERARAFLEDSVERNSSLEDVAQAVRVNKHVLVRRFRERYGTTPHAYLVMARIDRARSMLARGVAPGDVAMRLGFADQPHLTRAFRALVGLTPAVYQRTVRAVG